MGKGVKELWVKELRSYGVKELRRMHGVETEQKR